MKENFQKIKMETQTNLYEVMRDAELQVWRCDPKFHIEGQNYETMTRLLQGYIENEVDLNNDGTCIESCDHYMKTENFGCFQDLFCSKQRKCNGKLLNCQLIDDDMDICLTVRNLHLQIQRALKWFSI